VEVNKKQVVALIKRIIFTKVGYLGVTEANQTLH